MNKPLLKSVALGTIIAQFSAHAVPLLEITRDGNSVALKWPAPAVDWYVQTSTSLKAGSWGPVAQKPTPYPGYREIKWPLQEKQRFFRLALIDAPDPSYNDVNGDGIDGDAALAIFVVASGGSDSNPGTRALPVATLQTAIVKAAALGKDVYAGKGTYTPASSLSLSSGVSLYGQFDPGNNWSRSAANTTTIAGSTTAVLAQTITDETHVEGFTIKAAHATSAGDSSIGVRITSSAGPVFLRYNQIIAGNGAAGSHAGHGSNGTAGGNGMAGKSGSMDYGTIPGKGGAGGTSAIGHQGGQGGTGGGDPSYQGATGNPGTGGAAGGPGGGPGDPGKPGKDGADGANGASASSGIGGISFGSVYSGGYLVRNGNSGHPGTHGHGGGGGGGGGGQTCFLCDDGGGNGGGGGGGGGAGGNAGGPGGGGGGSFGILTYNSTATIDTCIITTGNGGAGGKGGNGGQGGAGGGSGIGGSWGVAEDELGRGGNGGIGGTGGRGGNGGGGGGGPSIGIKFGGSVTSSNNTFTIGAGGLGGAGGTNGGPSFPGEKGLSVQTN